MASSTSTFPLAHAALRPRRNNKPRSSSMHEASASDSIKLNDLLPMVQAQSHGPDLFKTESPFSPFLPAVSELEDSESSPTRDSKPRSSKFVHPPPAYRPSNHSPTSLTSHASSNAPTSANREVERIMAKPSLIRGIPRPRASTDSTMDRPPSLNMEEKSSAEMELKGRSAFYQAFAKSPPLSLPPPGESRGALSSNTLTETSALSADASRPIRPIRRSRDRLQSLATSNQTPLLLIGDLSPSPIPRPSPVDKITLHSPSSPLQLGKPAATPTMSMDVTSKDAGAVSHTQRSKHTASSTQRRGSISKITSSTTKIQEVASKLPKQDLVVVQEPSSPVLPSAPIQSSEDVSSQGLERPNSAPESLTLQRTQSTKERDLSLRLRIQPVSYKDYRHSRSSSLNSLLSPMSTVSTLAPLISPQKKVSEKELRRRRFNKLQRTLGEQIPLELLVPSISPTKTEQFHWNKKRESGSSDKWRRSSLSFTSRNSAPNMATNFSLAAPLEVTNPTGKLRITSPLPNLLKKHSASRQKRMIEPIVTISEDVRIKGLSLPESVALSPFNIASAPLYFESHPFRLVVEEPASSNPEEKTIQRDEEAHVFQTILSDDTNFPLSPDAPFVDYAITIKRNYLAIPDFSDPRGIYRREKRQGWSGEWNQPHIRDVIEKLRNL